MNSTPSSVESLERFSPLDSEHPTFPHRLRAAVEDRIRTFFAARDVLEIASPAVVPSPGMEPELCAFKISAIEARSHHGRYLHTSPEYAMKTALATLRTDIFTLARVFRDEPPGPLHHPEFTMLEWYRMGWDHHELMSETEALIRHVVGYVAPDFALESTPFPRETLDDLFERHVGCSASDASEDVLRSAAVTLGFDIDPSWDRLTLFSLLQGLHLERHVALDRPTFITEFPAYQAALARLSPTNPLVAERFELYLPWQDSDGPRALELANAFSELTDAAEQRARFSKELELRKNASRPVYPMPELMLAALEQLDAVAGIALGVERLLVWIAYRAFGKKLDVRDFFIAEPSHDASQGLY